MTHAKIARIHRIALSLCAFALALSYSLTASTLDLAKNPEICQFINQLAATQHFDKSLLQTWFRQVHYDPVVLKKMETPYEEQPWAFYQQLFVTPTRIRNGNIFWKEHNSALLRAQKYYGPPPAVITAIIGIETKYGRQKGDFPTLNALSTLAFEYPKRQIFFRRELVQFLLLSREQHWKPLTILGSYAGALGYPQFMPSSYRSYAVDFTGTGRIDLLHNPSDAIGSVANYLHECGWQANLPLAFPVKKPTNPAYLKLLSANAKPNTTLAKLKKIGVRLPTNHLPGNTAAALIELQGRDGPLYWVTLPNFYVITRYNQSTNYAMAATQLAEKLTEAHQVQHHKI